jgi:prophage regulatory protein
MNNVGSAKGAAPGSDGFDAILRASKVSNLIGVSRSTIYDWINPRSPRHDSSFPLPIRLSGRNGGAVGWLASDLQNWIDGRKAASRGGV